MTITVAQIDAWLAVPNETEHLEFKRAENSYDFEKLCRYCTALANERGGHLLLGVEDKPPRRVVGTRAFTDLQDVRERLFVALGRRIQIEEIIHPDGRVLVFEIPSRPVGTPLRHDGHYLMRIGERLEDMTPEHLQRIFSESEPDFSATVVAGATMAALDASMIADFRMRWTRRSGNARLQQLSDSQLLSDAGLLVDSGITVAAMVLFGRPEALLRYLPQAEIVFEYHAAEAAAPAQQRENFRSGFFGCYDRLWELVNLRNDRQSYQDGFFRYEVSTFDEAAVREAILNAVCHREYRSPGSVFVRQFPRRLSVESPGGLPPGVTPENVLDRQLPRNRRIAEALEKCGLVERSGQGMNLIYEAAIKAGKPLPEFTGTDAHQVRLHLRGELADPTFVRYLEKLGAANVQSFGTQDFLALAHVQNGLVLTSALRERLHRLEELGAVERRGRGYILSRDFYAQVGQPGAYTRKKGLDHETNKALLLRHLREKGSAGSPLSEFSQVLPSLSERRIQRLLQELKREGRTRVDGTRRWARWFVVTGI